MKLLNIGALVLLGFTQIASADVDVDFNRRGVEVTVGDRDHRSGRGSGRGDRDGGWDRDHRDRRPREMNMCVASNGRRQFVARGFQPERALQREALNDCRRNSNWRVARNCYIAYCR